MEISRGQGRFTCVVVELSVIEIVFLLSLSDLSSSGYYSMSEQSNRPTAFTRLYRAPVGDGVCRTGAPAR